MCHVQLVYLFVFKDDAKLRTNKLRRRLDQILRTFKLLTSHAHIIPKPADKIRSRNLVRRYPRR